MALLNREAQELLMIEEADAWFEYLEATRGQSVVRYAERLGMGAAEPAPASYPCTARQAAAGSRVACERDAPWRGATFPDPLLLCGERCLTLTTRCALPRAGKPGCGRARITTRGVSFATPLVPTQEERRAGA